MVYNACHKCRSGEMVAIQNGFYLAGNIGCNLVTVGSDSSNVVEALTQDVYLGPDAAVFSECKALVAGLTKVDVIHCFREANNIANSLAKYSLSNRSSEVWDSSILDFISHLFVHDLSII